MRRLLAALGFAAVALTAAAAPASAAEPMPDDLRRAAEGATCGADVPAWLLPCSAAQPVEEWGPAAADGSVDRRLQRTLYEQEQGRAADPLFTPQDSPLGLQPAPAVPTPAPGEPGVNVPPPPPPGPGVADRIGDVGRAASDTLTLGQPDLTCKRPPDPVMPKSGFTGWLGADQDTPPAGDPWAENPTTSVLEQYGWNAGAWLHTYDLGCADDALGPLATPVMSQYLVNLGNLPIHGLAKIAGSLVEAGYSPQWRDVLDMPVVAVQEVLHAEVWLRWGVIATCLVGIGVMLRFRDARLAPALSKALWVLLVTVLAALLVNYPRDAARIGDGTHDWAVREVVTRVNGLPAGDVPSDALLASVHDRVMLEAWRVARFGCSDCPVADEFEPVFIPAMHFSYAEQAEVEANPEREQELVEAKQRQFEEGYERLREEYPSAAVIFTGKQEQNTWAALLITWFGGLTTLPFLVTGAAAVLAAAVIRRTGIMLAPAVLTLALLYEGALRKGVAILVATIVNGALFLGLTAITMRVNDTLLGPEVTTQIPVWLAYVFAGIWTYVLWKISEPMRRTGAMLDGRTRGFGGVKEGRWSRKARRKVTRKGLKTVRKAAGKHVGFEKPDGKGKGKGKARSEGKARAESHADAASPDDSTLGPLYVPSTRGGRTAAAGVIEGQAVPAALGAGVTPSTAALPAGQRQAPRALPAGAAIPMPSGRVWTASGTESLPDHHAGDAPVEHEEQRPTVGQWKAGRTRVAAVGAAASEERLYRPDRSEASAVPTPEETEAADGEVFVVYRPDRDREEVEQ